MCSYGFIRYSAHRATPSRNSGKHNAFLMILGVLLRKRRGNDTNGTGFIRVSSMSFLVKYNLGIVHFTKGFIGVSTSGETCHGMLINVMVS